MAILNTIIASSAVALSILAQAATPVNALAAPHGHNHLARHVGTSPNHNGALKRKRNSHKNRKRCIAQQNPSSSSSVDTSNPAPTDNGSSNNSNGNTNTNTGSSNTNTGTYTGANSPTCQGGKVGLAWAPDLASNYIPNAKTSKTCFYYNWSSWAADGSLTSGLTFIPMFWGGDHVSDFQGNVIYSDNNYGLAMAMNEVNQDGQANVDAGTGASWWRQFLLPLRQNKQYYLISPSTTNAPSGMQWMQDWYNQLGDNEKPDGIAFHWYGNSYDDLVNYTNYVAGLFPGKDLWITEFACTDFSYQSTCNVGDFAPKAAAFLDSNPRVKSYFPFGFVGSMQGVQEDNRLMDGGGNVTPIGRDYIGW